MDVKILTIDSKDCSLLNNDNSLPQKCNKSSPDLKEDELLNPEAEKAAIPRSNNILCSMIETYGRNSKKTNGKKIVLDAAGEEICNTLDKKIKAIVEKSSKETTDAMKEFLEEVRIWKEKEFIMGLMKYLENPERKTELFNKAYGPPAPQMTKPEQILIYLISQLNTSQTHQNIVEVIFRKIEHILFRLNQTPDFDAIESLSHFYAVLCRYYGMRTRLRTFLLEAMYCIQFKSIPLIRQCLDVWMHILPLSHMGAANTPLVICLVYLLHFFKCEDKFHRVQDLRQILHRKYSYQMSDWSETRVLEVLKNAVHDLKDKPKENKLLRMSIILIAKRLGPKWCQKHIINKILQPMIDGQNVPARVKNFCISLYGPLLKPYPADMKVHCEVAMNKLLDLLNKNPPEQTQEAIFTSLIFMQKHNHHKVYQALLSYNPRRNSPEFVTLLRDHIEEKPLKSWIKIITYLKED